MRKLKNVRTAGMTVLAASLAVVFGPATAEEEVLRLITPESLVRVGAGYLTDDAARFGQYSGLKSEGLYGIADLDMVRRDDTTGTWLRFGGRNLGLESRSLRFEHERQGSWRYFVDYDKTPRFAPYAVNTGLLGIGTAVQTPTSIAPGAGANVRLKTVREAVKVGAQGYLGNGFDVQVRFKNDSKEGNRLFGTGTFGNQSFLAEPIDHRMQQLDVILGYTGEKLQLSGGYYGSFFSNEKRALVLTTGSPFPEIALPPDNSAHQVYLAGGYTLSPTMRANFKLSHGRATQDETFILPASPAAGRSNLGGRVDTTLAQLGLSARPMPKLSVIANLKYEDRDDKTPIRDYFTSSGTFSGTNEPRSLRNITGKLEASYQLPQSMRLTGGVDYDERKRTVYEQRLVAGRTKTDETTYRVELARGLSDTVNGSVTVLYSERDGSTLLPPGSVSGFGPLAPLHLADRDREKVKLQLGWMPAEEATIQLIAHYSRDDYSELLGPQEGKAMFWSLDGSYALSDDWQAYGWVSREDSRLENRSAEGRNPDQVPWQVKLRQTTGAYGVGVKGLLGFDWKIGADLEYSRDRGEFPLSGGATVPSSLPKVEYRRVTLKAYAEYSLQDDLALRFDVVHDRWKTNDWLWANYTYSDGTTLTQDPRQNTTFVGASIRYNWR